MTRTIVQGIALLAGLTLLLASPATSAELKEWDQATVTHLAKELREDTDTIRKYARATERPGPGSGLRRAHLRALDDLRRLQGAVNKLARQLENGVGRDDTHATFRRVRALRNELARTARRFIREPAPDKPQQAQGALDQLIPFYAAEDAAATS